MKYYKDWLIKKISKLFLDQYINKTGIKIKSIYSSLIWEVYF